MELKSIMKFKRMTDNIVLIVPLWNWNKHGALKPYEFLCFNRTFMELKSASRDLFDRNCLF